MRSLSLFARRTPNVCGLVRDHRGRGGGLVGTFAPCQVLRERRGVTREEHAKSEDARARDIESAFARERACVTSSSERVPSTAAKVLASCPQSKRHFSATDSSAVFQGRSASAVSAAGTSSGESLPLSSSLGFCVLQLLLVLLVLLAGCRARPPPPFSPSWQLASLSLVVPLLLLQIAAAAAPLVGGAAGGGMADIHGGSQRCRGIGCETPCWRQS